MASVSLRAYLKSNICLFFIQKQVYFDDSDGDDDIVDSRRRVFIRFVQEIKADKKHRLFYHSFLLFINI